MWTANLWRHLSFNHLGHHRILHPPSQRLTRNGVRCFSHNTSSNASAFPVRYISKRRQRHVDNQQSTSPVTHTKQGRPLDTTHTKMLKSQAPIFNHWDGHQKHFTYEQQVVDCMTTGQQIAHTPLTHKTRVLPEGIQFNQEGLGCMQATEEVVDVDKKQSTSSRTDISLQDVIPSTSDSTLFRCNSFQGPLVDRTQGKMPNTEGPILNLSGGPGKDFTDKEQIKVCKHVVDCMTTGQEIAHTPLTYKTGGLSEGIKLNQKFSSDGLVHEECMQATEEVVDVDKKQSTSSRTDISLQDASPSTSDSTVFRHNSFQGPLVDLTEGKMPNTEGPILNHSGGNGKDFTGKVRIKVRKQIVDEECMEATEEEFGDDDTYFHAKPDKTRKGAEKLTVDLLAKRAVTAVELRKKLVAKHFPLNIVEAVLRDFQGRGLINDGLYAEAFSHSRWKSSSWGPRRINQALSQKGVTEHVVKKAVKLVFEDSEEVEQGSSVKLSRSSLDQLYIQASKQWQRSRDAHPEKRKARVIRWLKYRGFDWDVIGTIIKKLESKHPRATMP